MVFSLPSLLILFFESANNTRKCAFRMLFCKNMCPKSISLFTEAVGLLNTYLSIFLLNNSPQNAKKKYCNSLPCFYPSTFVYSCFPPKIQFLYCLLSSVTPWGGPMMDTEGKMFWNLVCRLP